MARLHLVLLAGLVTGCGAVSHTVTRGEGVEAAPLSRPTASRHGSSSCTPRGLTGFSPSVGMIQRRTSGTTRLGFDDTPVALEVACGQRGPSHCLDSATETAPAPGAGQRRTVKFRTVVRGHTATLLLDSSEERNVYATIAEMVEHIRRLESENRTVKVQSVGRAVGIDWSTVDIRIKEPVQARDVVLVDLEWTHSPKSLRGLVEAVHVVVDELAQADTVVINQSAVLEQLGRRIVASGHTKSGQNADSGSFALIGAISSNYPAINDSHIERPFTVTLRTRCRVNFED